KTGLVLVCELDGVWISGKVMFRFAASTVPVDALLGAVVGQPAWLATVRPPLAAFGTRKAAVKVAKSPVSVSVVAPVIAAAQLTVPLLVGPLMQFSPVLASRSNWPTLTLNAPRNPDREVLRVPSALLVTNTAPGGFAGSPLPVRSISNMRDSEVRPKLVLLTRAKFGNGVESPTNGATLDACAVICTLALGLLAKGLRFG